MRLTGSSNYPESRAPGEGTLNGHATICMSAEFQFVDTNVLVYLFDDDTSAKQSRSRELFSESLEHNVLSPQVLSEFYV